MHVLILRICGYLLLFGVVFLLRLCRLRMPSTSSWRLSKMTPVGVGTGDHHAEVAVVTEEVLAGATKWPFPFPTTWLVLSLAVEAP